MEAENDHLIFFRRWGISRSWMWIWLLRVFVDSVSNGLCFHYYFSSHKTRETSQWNARKHIYPFSDFLFPWRTDGGECWGVKGMSLHVRVYWHHPQLICLFPFRSFLFLEHGLQTTGSKLEAVFNLPETTGDSWRCLWSDVLWKNRPGFSTSSNS